MLAASIQHEVEALEESAFLLTIAWPDPENLRAMKHRVAFSWGKGHSAAAASDYSYTKSGLVAQFVQWINKIVA